MSGINKLTDRQIKNLKPGARRIKIGDGDKLWLFVSPSGIKVWRMLWKEGNTQKQFTIGPYPTISLKEAREKRDAVNGLLVQGLDPNEQYRSEQEQQDEETNLTFRVVAQEWYEKRTVTQTESTRRLKMQRLERHVFPSFGDLPIKQLKPRDIILALHAIESQGRREMARRVGQIIGQICRYARVVGYLEYDISSGITEALEPKGPVQHRATITDPKKIGYLLRDIDDYPGSIVTKYALKILPYVFVRSQELRRARWVDIDFQKHLWVIPPEHMKMKRLHVVPLARQVEYLLKELHTWTGGGEFLFPSPQSRARVITDMCLLNALRRVGYGKEELCIHGFRAMASTLLNEQGFRADVIEAQLAHREKNAVRAAYNHAQYLPERAKMMQSWADYLDELRTSACHKPSTK